MSELGARGRNERPRVTTGPVGRHRRLCYKGFELDIGPVVLQQRGASPIMRRTPLAVPFLRLRHLARTTGEFAEYAVVNRAWWVLPIMVLLALATLLIIVGQAAAPITLYPLF